MGGRSDCNRILNPERDDQVLDYRVGLTDLVKSKAASSDSSLRRGDYDVGSFVGKIEKHDPGSVAFNGKTAASVVARFLSAPRPDLGPADFSIGGSRVYVLPSSSGSRELVRAAGRCLRSSRCRLGAILLILT